MRSYFKIFLGRSKRNKKREERKEREERGRRRNLNVN